MTFTYDITLSSDLAKTRFHIGDTDADAQKFQDETILAVLASEGDVGHAVIALLNGLIATLSDPSFTADWLRVNPAAAREGVLVTLAIKRREFGISAGGGRRIAVYRSDYPTESVSATETEE